MEKEPQKRSLEKFKAVMLLAATGDAMGYKNGDWEFQTAGQIIHQQMMEMTKNKGPLALTIDLKWRYSDDTVMHIATAKALSMCKKSTPTVDIAKLMAIQYKKCWSRMAGRAPGRTCGKSINILNEDGSNWDKMPYMDRAAGCGGSMRSACIGLVFDSIDKVIEVSLEAGRLTHHNPIGYLGSVVSSCFTFYAINGVDPLIWAALLFKEIFPKAKEYVIKTGRQLQRNLKSEHWKYFEDAWTNYIKKRKLSKEPNEPVKPTFPVPYGIMEREHFYKQVSYSGWGGASGHDSVIIAYDVILGCGDSWQELCLRGILHGGDNDSTGTIAGAWFGALNGFQNVPQNHYRYVEDNQQLVQLAVNLHKVATN